MAYKLQLPEGSSVHPVFHVSLLKLFRGNLPTISTPLPSDNMSVQVPELVLDRCLQRKNNRVVVQLLIKWHGWPLELATWEDDDEVRALLPEDTTCGQAAIKGGRDVTKPNSPKRVFRAKKPSVRFSGPEWAK